MRSHIKVQPKSVIGLETSILFSFSQRAFVGPSRRQRLVAQGRHQACPYKGYQGRRSCEKSGISGLAHTFRCAFSGVIANLADLKGLRQPNFHTFQAVGWRAFPLPPSPLPPARERGAEGGVRAIEPRTRALG